VKIGNYVVYKEFNPNYAKMDQTNEKTGAINIICESGNKKLIFYRE